LACSQSASHPRSIQSQLLFKTEHTIYFYYPHYFQTVKTQNQAAMFSKSNTVSLPTGSGLPQPMSDKEREERIKRVLSVIDDVLDLISETADDDQ
jgi:hypothetical protein